MGTELAAELGARADVERGERLVEEQRGVGSVHERARERDALLLTAGQHRRLRARAVGETDALEPLRRRAGAPRPRPTPRLRSPNATFSQHARGAGTGGSSGTRHPTDRRSGTTNTSARGSSTDDAVDRRRARLEREQPRERAQQRGLARAVRAEHRDRLALGGVDRHVEVEVARVGARRQRQASRSASEPAVAQRARARRSRPTSSTRLSTIAVPCCGLEEQVDRERHGLGAALDVAGERDRGAELAERARPRQRGAGPQRRARSAGA